MPICNSCDSVLGCDDGRYIHGDTSRILDLRCRLTANLKGLTYKGPWNAYIGWPQIPPADESNEGYYLIVSVPGNTVIDGVGEWELNDWVVSTGESWVKVDNNETVLSVNGDIGQVLVKTLYDDTGNYRVLVPVINEDHYLVLDNDPLFDQIIDLINFKHGHIIEKKNITLLDVNNKYIYLLNIPDDNEKVELRIIGAPSQGQGYDYVMDSIDLKKLKWDGLGLDGILESGDHLIIEYTVK